MRSVGGTKSGAVEGRDERAWRGDGEGQGQGHRAGPAQELSPPQNQTSLGSTGSRRFSLRTSASPSKLGCLRRGNKQALSSNGEKDIQKKLCQIRRGILLFSGTDHFLQ